MTGFLIIATFLLQIHSWYDPYCCSDKDCHPVPCEELIEQNDGTVKYQNYTIQKHNVKPSQDNQCHVCIFNDMARCAYVIQGS